MRTFRVLVLAALAAGSLTVLAPAASASAPAVSKTCRSLNTLQNELDTVDPSDASSFDFDHLEQIGDAFHKAARTAPKKLKSALNTMGDIYEDMSDADNPAGAILAFSRNGQKYSKAFVQYSKYLTTNCLGTG